MSSFLSKVNRAVLRTKSAVVGTTLNKLNTRSFYQKFNPTEDQKTLAKYALVAAATGIGLIIGLRKFTSSKQPKVLTLDSRESQSLRKRFNFIDKVVQKCAGSVVYIEIRDPNKMDLETDQPLTSSNGSGFIIGEDGWILTNAHVVVSKPQSIVMVMLQDGSAYKASVEDADMNMDLALLKIDAKRKLPYLSLGKTSDITTGEWVIALGSPLSLSHSVTAGVISSVSRGAEDLGLKNFSMRYIQTDAAITFGNSGGPLVNLDGDVVGINNLRVTAGIAFAIPVDYAKLFLDRSRFAAPPSKVNLNKDNRRVLGITTISINPEIIAELKNMHKKFEETLTHGVFVWKVIQGTIAHASGLQIGDIITHINDLPVYQARDIYEIDPENSKLKLEIVREGERKDIFVN